MHTLFDLLAWISGPLFGLWVRRRWLAEVPAPSLRHHPLYFAAAVIGMAVGAFGFGTLNLMISGHPGIGRSVVGGLFGAIAAVELYKLCRGYTGSTGLAFVAPLALGIAVGRIGCLLDGLDDYTYGLPTALPWGVDFGDGVFRHPVQAYESLAMLLGLGWFLQRLARGDELVMRHGFALFVAFYAGQRFVWEFLKPYSAVVGPFNLFHLVCTALVLYASVMLWRRGGENAG